jgi:hypothetical protein
MLKVNLSFILNFFVERETENANGGYTKIVTEYAH